jgi:hypothetical protein
MNAKDMPRICEVAPDVWCSVPLMEEISERAAEGYRRMAWGGVEMGGLVLGTRDGNSVIAARDLRSGMRAQARTRVSLVGEGQDRMEATIAEVATGPLSVVGLFRTTSTELAITREDVVLANRYFAEPWQ